jgi:hypothetical protein
MKTNNPQTPPCTCSVPGLTPLVHRRDCPRYVEPSSAEIVREVSTNQCMDCGGFSGAHFDDCSKHPLQQIVTPPSEPHIGAGSPVVHLAEALDDNTKWSPKQAAEAFIRDIDAGKIDPKRVIILYEIDLPNDCKSLDAIKANVNDDYMITMLHMKLFMRSLERCGMTS